MGFGNESMFHFVVIPIIEQLTNPWSYYNVRCENFLQCYCYYSKRKYNLWKMANGPCKEA